MEIPESFLSEIFTRQVQNPSVELQSRILKNFESEQTQVVNERLRLQHQRRIEAAI